MPEALKQVFKKDLEGRTANDAEQELINERHGKGEPIFEEDREGYVPPEEGKDADALKGKAVELGLPEDATQEDIEAKEQENEEARKAEEEKGEEEEHKEEGEEEGEEEEGAEEDFEKADEQGKLDMITEREIDLANEEDEDQKKIIQEELEAWKKSLEAPAEEEEEVDAEAEIEAYAKEKEVSVEDARTVIEGRDAIIKKYSKNPKKMASALRSLQGEFTKEKEAHINTAKALEESRMSVMLKGDIKPEKIINGGKFTKEEVIDLYRKSYEGLTEDKSDAEVYDMCRKDTLQRLHSKHKEDSAALQGDAAARRAELMSNLPKEAEPYKKAIKAMLDDSSDIHVVQEGFDLEDMIFWHKGQDFDRAVKEANQEGYKRGLENRKIKGELKPRHKPKKGAAAGDKNSFGLSDEEKIAARDFYATNPIPEKRKYELYADILASEKKLKEKKDKDKEK